MFEDLLSLLFPETCYACTGSLARGEKYICTNCSVKLPYTDFHVHGATESNPLQRRFWGKVPVAKLYEEAGVSDGLAPTAGTIGESVKRGSASHAQRRPSSGSRRPTGSRDPCTSIATGFRDSVTKLSRLRVASPCLPARTGLVPARKPASAGRVGADLRRSRPPGRPQGGRCGRVPIRP